MQSVLEQNLNATKPADRPFVDRRGGGSPTRGQGPERRQFSATVDTANPDVAELSAAVDRYKLEHRRRFITFDELHAVITALGYHK
jgi:hypothetical protein